MTIGGFQTPIEVGRIADGLAAVCGELETITIKEVDAVQVGQLTSGKADVKALRKSLIRKSETLTTGIVSTYEALKQIKAGSLGTFPTPTYAAEPAEEATRQQIAAEQCLSRTS